LLDIQANDDIGASVGLENEHDLFLWNVVFEGPADTLYEVSKEVFWQSLCFNTANLIVQGGFFKSQLKFPLDYPNNPPEMKFLSKMWHPNSK
jgi:ubiquitin-protein ligase